MIEDMKNEFVWITTLYRMAECGDAIPVEVKGTNYEFIAPQLDQMHVKDLICISEDNERWEVAAKGEALLGGIVAAFDQSLKFNIFARVKLDGELSETVSEDGLHVFDHCHDPRFPTEDGPGVVDMRLAMIDLVTVQLATGGKTDVIPPAEHFIVLLQKLADGEFSGSDFWWNLSMGTYFEEIEKIATTAYKWTDLSADFSEALEIGKLIYTAGMLEQRKRDGYMCSGCSIPLAIFEMNVFEETGKHLNTCPNPDCGASFAPPKLVATHECPNCQHDIFPTDRACKGCGAVVDRTLAAGTVETSTSEETAPVWSRGYGEYDYTPTGYYDPYDPFRDALAIGLMCAIILD